MRDSGIRGLHRGLLMVAALLAGLLVRQVANGQGVANGGFESGDFTGWTVVLHQATGPTRTGGDIPTGGQVLTGKNFWRDGTIKPGLHSPEGTQFALISSTPGTAEDGMNTEWCPTSQEVPSSAPNVDGDQFDELDVTTLSQDFVVSSLPAQLSFTWSFLNSETTTGYHDTFEATLTKILPLPGSAIQLLGVTAGNSGLYPPGTFTFLAPGLFDSSTYEVVTIPAGGPTDCFYVGEGQGVGVGLGRTAFAPLSTPITSPGTYRLSFYFGDDGGDARMDSGVIIDGVRVMTPPQAAGLCAVQPRTDCIASLKYGAGRLSIQKKVADPTKDQIVWKWTKGPGLIVLGNPVTTTTYELCVYDAWGLVTRVAAPAGGTCAGQPCWVCKGSVCKYADPDGTPDGMFKVTLTSGAIDTKSSIKVKGKGTNLAMPTLPLVLPVTGQMVNSDGTCFSNTFSKAGKSTDAKLTAKSE